MTGETILAPTGEGTGVIPLETADAARRVRVRKVFQMLSEPGISNLTQALREAGVATSTFCQDMKHPVIKARYAEYVAAVDEASRQLILGRRLEVLHHQQRIASGEIGDPRDSTLCFSGSSGTASNDGKGPADAELCRVVPALRGHP